MKPHNLLTVISALLAAGMIAGCTGSRGLAPANVELPAMVGRAGGDTVSAAQVDYHVFYTDTLLLGMIDTALAHNRNLAEAAARVEELRQLYGVQQLNYLPDITGLVGANNETNDYHGEPRLRDPEYDVKVTVSWEIDLWGGLSASRRRAQASYLGAVENRRAMQIVVIAETATAYYNLVALQNELNIVRQTLLTRRQALDKTRLRFEGGLTSEIVYQQAKVEYATTAALEPDLERRITLAENALNLLMGRLPGTPVRVNADALSDELPESVPAGVPSQLLERRPDIRSSEQALRAALAEVDVAYSNQFPRLTIGLTGGLENCNTPWFLNRL